MKYKQNSAWKCVENKQCWLLTEKLFMILTEFVLIPILNFLFMVLDLAKPITIHHLSSYSREVDIELQLQINIIL